MVHQYKKIRMGEYERVTERIWERGGGGTDCRRECMKQHRSWKGIAETGMDTR